MLDSSQHERGIAAYDSRSGVNHGRSRHVNFVREQPHDLVIMGIHGGRGMGHLLVVV